MSSHYRNPPAILGLFVLMLCLGTDLAAQSPYAPATASDAVQQQPQPLIRKFTFKHASAADVLQILQQLAGPTDHIGLKIAVDERTNSFVFQPDDDRQARELEETCVLLDTETPSPSVTGNGISISVPALGPTPQQKNQAFSFSMGFERSESIETLKQRYKQIEQQAHQLADKLNKSTSLSDSQRTELQLAVRKSFEARQALQRAELADLAQRMKSMQQSIDMRDKLADKVVQRRVEDLLNPNLKWDAGKVSEQLLVGPNQSSSNPARPLPPSAFPSNVSAPYVPREPPATVIRKKIQGRWIVQTFSVGDKDALPELAGQVEVVIEGNSMRYLVGKQEFTGPIFLANCKELESPTLAEDGPLPIDFIHDPNGDPQTSRGIIACDETRLSICMASDEGMANKEFRPSLFVPGTKAILIKCHRVEPETAKAVSVDQTTCKSAVQQATSKLLLAYRVPQNIDPNVGPKVIALIDIDYQGKQEAGDLKEEIYEWIESNVPVASPGRFTLLNRRVVVLAMMETKLRPSDLANSNPSFLENRQRILEHLRRHDVKLDSLLITSLMHMGDSDNMKQNQFELTLEGFIDAQTSWFERVTLKGKANGPLKETESNSLRQFATPQELLDAAEQHGKSGSYEDFVTLFNDKGVRDLAGSLLMSALQLTGSVDLAKNQGAEASSGTDSGVAAVSEVLKRWLPQSSNAEQLKAMRDGLSMTLNAIGGTSRDQPALQEFVISMRKSVEGIRDHRKFCVEMMRAYEKLTTKPFVYFGNSERQSEWQVSEFGARAIATLVDGSPGIATTITLQQASGNWKISSLFNELVEMTKQDESGARPITPAMEMQQRLQGEWDVKVMGYSPDIHVIRPYQAVVRGQLFLLQCMEDGKVIGTSTWKMIWPEADHPDVVDIVWDPNNNSDEYCVPGRITCDGKSFQVAWRSDDSISGPAIRPTEICSGEGISYFECVRKQPADQSPTSTSSDAPVGPKYSGHPLSWWLDSYWDNATAIPKTAENAAQEFVASEAIRQLREKPECEAFIEAALAKWFASVEHEVNEGQLTRAAKCIVTVAGPAHQETAVKLLFKIWKRMPLLTYAEQGEMADDDTELNQLLSQLVLNEQLAAQFADRLTNGDSSDRSLVLYGLLSLMGRFGVETNKDLTELENWLRKHAERFAPAVEAASHDANEQIRFTSLIQLATLIHATKLDPELVRLPKILLTAASDAAPNVRYIAIELLTSNELAPSVKSQNIELSPILVKTLESDTSIDVRYSALGALMKLDAASEVVHATLLEWARGKERLQVENALSLMLRNHAAGDRPQSIDELIELLSAPEWGNTVEVKQSNWSTYHRWARQYAIAILGQYAAHAHRAIPTLEAELALNNKDTLSFATVALDRVRGYCPDLPIDKLQGEWEFVSIQKPEGSSPFFDFQTSPEQQPSSSVKISGTQLKQGGRVLAELSHYRSGSRQGVALLLDPDGKKRHCHGGYNFKSSPSPEYKPNVAPAPELLIVEVIELLNNRDATQTTKQIYEFRRISK